MEFELSESLKISTRIVVFIARVFNLAPIYRLLKTQILQVTKMTFRNNVQLNFLTIPLLMKFGINDKLDAQVGPQFGFLINQITKTKNLERK